MRILLGTLVIWLASAVSTMAATKYALSGVPITLFQASSTNPDCSANGIPTIRVTQDPQHGRITITRGGVFAYFSPSNARSACNKRRVPGVIARYVSQRGYTGTDTAAIEVFFPSGQAGRTSYFISVR